MNYEVVITIMRVEWALCFGNWLRSVLLTYGTLVFSIILVYV